MNFGMRTRKRQINVTGTREQRILEEIWVLLIFTVAVIMKHLFIQGSGCSSLIRASVRGRLCSEMINFSCWAQDWIESLGFVGKLGLPEHPNDNVPMMFSNLTSKFRYG